MQKTIIFAFALVLATALCQAPSPIPVPNFDLSHIEGQWYVNFIFDPKLQNETLDITCYTVNYEIDGSNITANVHQVVNGSTYNNTAHFTAESKDSVWKLDNGEEWAFIVVDALQWKSFFFVSETEQKGAIASKSAVLDFDIVAGDVVVGHHENYNIGADNSLTIHNTC
eukprot:CAMPEP_0114588542 /NCGR_PEP_ID=MMETSP0125-20121206/11215_1 /TAXON_ID=485358 ORGANISM="Aristerostoma sp., Strain ATCC 50986" /NCGR_SAMPLE_ID=MMETSP0125 /ASSEMBLY_ACC=CAM_ASM_000245 /LENGTH=168 /DNA_ID=CAMNT_0001784983 /DNA_START=42 /DNA_END=548 /DNA_ORIENTATION=-